MANDALIMPYIQSCTIACGGHAGDRESIRKTIQLAQKYKVKIGAHPSYPDRKNFGRKRLNISVEKLGQSIRAQLNVFFEVSNEEGADVHHLKLHGALYNDAANDDVLAKMVVNILRDYPGLKLYAPFGSLWSNVASEGIELVPEGFIDRSYEADLSLRNRSKENAVIKDPAAAVQQLQQMLQGTIQVNQEIMELKAKTYCIHGDNPNALAILKAIQKELYPRIRSFGDGAILLEWWDEISEELQLKILNAQKFIEEKYTDQILEMVPAYQSLAVYLGPEVEQQKVLEELSKVHFWKLRSVKRTYTTWVVPVCYEKEFAIDLAAMCAAKKMDREALIALHTSRSYPIHFMGFLPGFIYLGKLDERLHHPRKADPELLVPAGSVAIGGEQTGIYPQESPGGWHIIGATPANLFDANSENPVAWKAGDRIRFDRIDRSEYERIKQDSNFQLQIDIKDD
jgi:KipI family sensor histidine kinase inhibitor